MTKILVIEDEELIRENLIELLEAEGFTAIAAANGLQGLRLAKEELPQLILCDVMMPELDGYMVLALLRNDPVTATIPLIFLTAKVDRQDLRQGMNLGADDYITKPFTQAELLTAIGVRLQKQTVVDRQSQEQLQHFQGNLVRTIPEAVLAPLKQIMDSALALTQPQTLQAPQTVLTLAETITCSAQHLDRVIQNWLLYALLEVTASDPEQVKDLKRGCATPSQELITEVAVQKAQQCDRLKDLRLSLDEVTVPILEANFQKIIEELVDNALKFSAAGTPIAIQTTVQNHWFVLNLTDYGQGMGADQIASLGKPMRFEHKLQAFQNSGLGLTLVKRLVELHDGELTIKSILTEQTTIRVSLPLD